MIFMLLLPINESYMPYVKYMWSLCDVWNDVCIDNDCCHAVAII